MLNSIITLKSRLGVTQPMNLCMISTLLKSRLWAIVLLLIVWSFTPKQQPPENAILG